MNKIIGTLVWVFWLPFSLLSLGECSKAFARDWSDQR